MASTLPPVKGAAFSFPIALVSQADTDVFKETVTLAAGDIQVSKDGGQFANLATFPPSELDLASAADSGVLWVTLTATEMTADLVTVLFRDAAGAEWQSSLVFIQTAGQTLDTTDGVADTISGKIIGTLATGTHNAQSGDAYAVVTNATYGLDKLARTGADSDTLKTLSDQIDTVDAATIAAAVWAVASGSGAEDTYGNILDDLTEESGGTYRFTTAALAQGPGGGGTTYSDTITVTDGSNPLDGVFIELSTDSGKTNVIYAGTTNASGQLTVYSDTAGTHYAWMQLAGYTFTNPTAVTLA